MELCVNVKKSFGGFSLDTEFASAGDRLGIFGESGSGKSTLANLLAGTMLVLLAAFVWVYTSPRAYAYRYLFPGIGAALVFVVFPMLYTVRISFTNYSSRNLLSFDRATRYLLEETYRAEGATAMFPVGMNDRGDVVGYIGNGYSDVPNPFPLDPEEPRMFWRILGNGFLAEKIGN